MSTSVKKNSIYSLLKTGAAVVFPLITFPYISRVLLTDNVGKIYFGLSIVSYFSLIASLGISTYAIRECSSLRTNKDDLSKTASQLFSISIITTVIAYIALALTLVFCHKLEGYRTLIVLQSTTIAATTMGAEWLNSAMEDFKYISLRTIAFQVLSIVLMFIFVHKPEDYMKYVLISLVSSAGASIMNVWYRRKYCRCVFTLRIDWRRHAAPILFLFVTLLAQTLFNSVDSTMLGLIHDDFEVGIYGAAHKILNIISQGVGSLLWVVMPRLALYFSKEDYESVNKLLRKVLQFNITLGLPCIIGTVVLSRDVIRVVAGEAFISAAPVLQILMIGFLFSLFGGSFLGNAILLPSKQEKYYMYVCCFAAVVNIIANYVAIPMWGAKAAAGTTAVCALTILVLLLLKIDKRIHIERAFRVLIAPVFGCAVIALVCIALRGINGLYVRTFVSIALSATAYALIQILLKNEIIIELLTSVYLKVFKKR